MHNSHAHHKKNDDLEEGMQFLNKYSQSEAFRLQFVSDHYWVWTYAASLTAMVVATMIAAVTVLTKLESWNGEFYFGSFWPAVRGVLDSVVSLVHKHSNWLVESGNGGMRASYEPPLIPSIFAGAYLLMFLVILVTSSTIGSRESPSKCPGRARGWVIGTGVMVETNRFDFLVFFAAILMSRSVLLLTLTCYPLLLVNLLDAFGVLPRIRDSFGCDSSFLRPLFWAAAAVPMTSLWGASAHVPDRTDMTSLMVAALSTLLSWSLSLVMPHPLLSFLVAGGPFVVLTFVRMELGGCVGLPCAMWYQRRCGWARKWLFFTEAADVVGKGKGGEEEEEEEDDDLEEPGGGSSLLSATEVSGRSTSDPEAVLHMSPLERAPAEMMSRFNWIGLGVHFFFPIAWLLPRVLALVAPQENVDEAGQWRVLLRVMAGLAEVGLLVKAASSIGVISSVVSLSMAAVERVVRVKAMERQARHARAMLRYLAHEARVPLNSIVLGSDELEAVLASMEEGDPDEEDGEEEEEERSEEGSMERVIGLAGRESGKQNLEGVPYFVTHDSSSSKTEDAVQVLQVHPSSSGAAMAPPHNKTPASTMALPPRSTSTSPRHGASAGAAAPLTRQSTTSSQVENIMRDVSAGVAEARSILRGIAIGAESIQTVLNDLLYLESASEGRLSFELAPTNPAQVLRRVCLTFRADAWTKGVALEYDVGEDVPPTVFADLKRLTQAVSNFVSNAIKFAPEHSTVCLRADVAPTQRDGWRARELLASQRASSTSSSSPRMAAPESSPALSVLTLRLSVKDTGPGMTAEQQARVFQPFEQVTQAEKMRNRGTGLGMAITKSIIEMLGGQVGIISSPGCGSTFYADIPMAQVSSMAIDSDPVPQVDSFRPTHLDHDHDHELPLRSGGFANSLQQSSAALRVTELSIPPVDATGRLPSSSTTTTTTTTARVTIFNTSTMDVSIPASTAVAMVDAAASRAIATITPAARSTLESGAIGTKSTSAPAITPTMMGSESARENPLSRHVPSSSRVAAESAPTDGTLRRRTRGRRRQAKTLHLEGSGCPASILLVDDDDLTRSSLARQLQSLGWEVDTAETGEVALELIEERSKSETKPLYCVVLLDFQLPGLDGDEVLAILRKKPYFSTLPVIGLTGHSLTEDTDLFRRAGASHILAKPMRAPQVDEFLRTILKVK